MLVLSSRQACRACPGDERLRPMLAQRPILEGAGVVFEPGTNHEVL